MIIQQSVKMLFSIFILPPNAFNFLDLKTILTGDFIVFLSDSSSDVKSIMWSMGVILQEQLLGRSGAVVATAGVVRRRRQMLFSYHSVRQ